MEISTQRRFLGAVAVALLLGALGAGIWSMTAIEPTDVNLAARQAPGSDPESIDAVQPQAIDDPVSERPLRGPLYDPPARRPEPPPPPPVKRPSPPPAAPPEVTLVGTIIQPDQALAILADASGKFDIKGIGQSLELSPPGITVEDIESEQVTLKYQGRQSTLRLDRQLGKRRAPEKSGSGRRARERGKNR